MLGFSETKADSADLMDSYKSLQLAHGGGVWFSHDLMDNIPDILTGMWKLMKGRIEVYEDNIITLDHCISRQKYILIAYLISYRPQKDGEEAN